LRFFRGHLSAKKLLESHQNFVVGHSSLPGGALLLVHRSSIGGIEKKTLAEGYTFQNMSSFPQSDNMLLAQSAVERRLLMRRRYQKGTLLQRGKRELLWVGRWLEDEIRTDGTVHRRHKSAPLGAVNELTKPQARRELDKILAPINAGLRTTRHGITFMEFTERWKTDILIHHKASGQTSERAHISKWLVPALVTFQSRTLTSRLFSAL
jgi:hypothetical protein